MMQVVPLFDHRRALFIYETFCLKGIRRAFVVQSRFDVANYTDLITKS